MDFFSSWDKAEETLCGEDKTSGTELVLKHEASLVVNGDLRELWYSSNGFSIEFELFCV